MNLKSGVIVIFSCLLTLCHTQRYSYPAQRRSSYSYRQPSHYSQSKTNFQSTSNRNFPVNTSAYYNTLSNTASKSSHGKQSSQKNPYPYNSSTGYYKTTNKPYAVNRNYAATSPSQGYYRASVHSPASSTYTNNAKGSYYSAANSATSKPYLANSYNQNYNVKDTNTGKYRITKADSENAKFAGAANQEDEEDGRTAYLKRRKLLRRFGNQCLPFGRDASNGVTPPPKEQGRFLWDINVYNVYPQTGGANGCGGFGGGGGGIAGGLLSDPIAAAPYYPPGAGLATFLSLFAPGILQNSLAVTARPQQFADQYQQDNDNDLQSDPEVDPNYNRPAPLPVRRPNQILYDSAGAVSI